MMKNIVPMLLFICCCLAAPFTTYVWAGNPRPVVREEVNIVIDGIQEQWRLEWAEAPVPACGLENEDWMTCPCTGFAYGERGRLNLVRKRPGLAEEHFPLTPLFQSSSDLPIPNADHAEAVLMKWEPQPQDLDNSEQPGFFSEVKARPPVRIMRFGDYDHDGRSSEFVLQIDTLPCGKKMSVVVGVSKNNNHLHAFSPVSRPEVPLILQSRHWEMLRTAQGIIDVVQWPCGDHGYDGWEIFTLQADKGSIQATKKRYDCNGQTGQKGRLREETAF